MRWVKHLTMAHADPVVSLVLEKYGAAAYGAYWIIVEFIAEGNNEMTVHDWSRATKYPRAKVLNLMQELHREGRWIVAKKEGLLISVEIPGLQTRVSDGRVNSEQWAELRRAVFERDHYTCRYCGVSSVSMECDHDIPVCRGGSSDIANLVTACAPCNRSKHDKTGKEFLIARGAQWQ